MKLSLLFSLFILVSITSFAQEVIPFTLKNDNRIYLNGVINQSDTLDLVFDLGANITVINKTRMKKNNVNITFDSLVSNSGTNGLSEEEKSFSNQVILGNRKYSNIDILGISYPENDILDGIIGWNFFKDKIVHINYESKKLLVYENDIEIPIRYSKRKLKFINNLPFTEIIIFKGEKKVKTWAMLDTGWNAELLVYYPSVIKNNLLNQYHVIGESTTSGTDGSISKSDWVKLPKTNLGGFEIYNMPAYLTKTKFDSHIPALLGGNVLKRFHIILDFEKNLVYFKPNNNFNSKF
tara:strand:- start:14451 stop:15332 length:882 start_codon:yes stop_codon:yes gene_type:complete